MSLTQLDPRSKGPGWAHFVIDYGQESALLWVVFGCRRCLLDGAEPRGPHGVQLDHRPPEARSRAGAKSVGRPGRQCRCAGICADAPAPDHGEVALMV